MSYVKSEYEHKWIINERGRYIIEKRSTPAQKRGLVYYTSPKAKKLDMDRKKELCHPQDIV